MLLTHVLYASLAYEVTRVVAPFEGRVSWMEFTFFFVALTSWVEFFCCSLVLGTLALDFPTLIL